MKPGKRRGLSTTGRLVALVAAVGIVVLFSVFDVFPRGATPTAESLLLLVRIATVVVGSALAGCLWDRVTGNRPEEVRGRRSWSDDPTLQRVQRMEENSTLIGALCLGLFWFGSIAGLWLSGQRALAVAMTALAAAGIALVWALTRKRRPYRLKEHQRARRERESRVIREGPRATPDESMNWAED